VMSVFEGRYLLGVFCHMQVSSLLALGADRKIVDKRGRTPEDCSVDPLVKGIFAEDTKKVS